MAVRNYKQKSVPTHDFAMIPRADIPRAAFPISKDLKTTFSASYLIPIWLEEVLPGDTWHVTATIVARTATPIVPVMDNWHLETFFFFVPNRLLWTNWQKFMGEQDNPGDSTSYTIPQTVSPAGGWLATDLADYLGLPCAGQVLAGNTISVNALPFRAYNLIFNQWFRDENLRASVNFRTNDGPDLSTDYSLLARGKRHDYFTSCLPFVQKGTSVSLPLGTTATVKANPTALLTGSQQAIAFTRTTGAATGNNTVGLQGGVLYESTAALGAVNSSIYPNNLYADLSTATAATINQLRQSFQIQKLLERDARGGTRYTEIVRSHFGVISPDARLQRPEYLGGGHTPVINTAIPQTSATGVTGATTPIGTLASIGHAQGRNGFTYAATEHGYLIGLITARADLTYQNGMRKLWSRATRYDFYFPVFAALGEQAVLNREIYADGSANDAGVFGYQERWAEYRYNPSQITGLFRSRTAGTLDYWHSSQNFASLPTLNATFIADPAVTTLQRNFAGGAQTVNQQFLCDIYYTGRMVRPLPMYSVPGLVDHF